MNILKQSAGWVTDLKRRFAVDIFFSTRVKILASLISFVLFIALCFIVLLEHIEKVILSGVVESLQHTVDAGLSDPAILARTSEGAALATYSTIFLIILIALFCGFIVFRLALSPLQQAFNIQKRFISGMAHELRTPLSILRMNNEIARFGVTADSPILPLLNENIADIDRITEMLSNLLLFDRMALVDAMKFSSINLMEVLQNSLDSVSELAAEKKISIVLPDAPIPLVHGNQIGLEQVFFSLLKNAISFTPKGGEVRVVYSGVKSHSVIITINDTGVGISKKDLPHVFEPFYRSEKAGKLSGTGIGLALVYEIMKLHKGTIEIESVEGEGTSFTFSFPMAKEHEQNVPPPTSVSFDFSKTV